MLLSSDTDKNQVDISVITPDAQRRPGPVQAQWKIPRSVWPEVLRRVDQGETYRQIASHYGMLYEAVRRVVKAARHEKR